MNQELTFPLDYGWLLREKDLNNTNDEFRAIAVLPLNSSDFVNKRITLDAFYRLFETAQSSSPDKIIALEIEKVWSVESFSLIHYAVLHSHTLIECLERLQRFESIYAPELTTISENHTEIMVTIDFLPSVIDVPSALIEFTIVTYIKLARLGTRKEIKPISVVATTDMDPQAYYKYFGVYPKKGDVNRIVFSKEDAEYPFVTFDENIWKLHEQALQNSLDHRNRSLSCSSKVQSAILQLLPSGKFSIEDIAEKLNISKRTLQRNLKTESTSFSEQLNSIREKRARYYLIETDLPCEEISDLLGYNHPTSFTRAFAEWTGTSPLNFRTTN